MADASLYLTRLWQSGALLVRDPPFTLKSGRQSHIYANHRNLVCVPDDLRLLTSLLYDTLRGIAPFEVALASVDSTVSPVLCSACSVNYELPMYSYRQTSSERGVSGEVFGYDRNRDSLLPAGLPAVLLDDVVTTNSTVERAASALKDAGVDVLAAVCLLDRRLPDVRDEARLVVRGVATLDDALTFGLEHGHVDGPLVPAVNAERTMLGDR
jgi:orotate phosphoribosyltransferase